MAPTEEMEKTTKPNRLINEKSPYLLQHAYNPVDWRPWGEEAFRAAREENKPIFLSIGYSTCHWCHVMERESFVDEGVAALLNSLYIPVKVDREERPDIDQVHMRVCQALNGSGGWPLTIVLTPSGEPFFAATYMPKDPAGGRPGLTTLLEYASKLWIEDPARINDAATKLKKALEISSNDYPSETPAFDPILFSRAAAELSGRFDEENGGFGNAPKFPTPHALSFLMARHRATGSERLRHMAVSTLDTMRSGGLWDHVGGGFHRYSTDKAWQVPHFEKMLYDQAGLAKAYLDAWLMTREERFKSVVLDILSYVEENLSDPLGGFYCGEDADSEGVEGLFYLWTGPALKDILGPDADGFFADYAITDEGNFTDEATGKKTGLNMVRGIDRSKWHAIWKKHAKTLSMLKKQRAGRIRPSRDDKVLTGWTSMMAVAFAGAGHAFGMPELIDRADKAVDFILTRMTREGSLLRRYRDGESAIGGFSEDYACLGLALVELYTVTGRNDRLTQAALYAGRLWEDFRAGDGGLYDTPADGEKLLIRPREATDGAAPSPASTALEVFARLALITGEETWAKRASSLIASESGLMENFPGAFTRFLTVAALAEGNPRTLTIHGPKDADETAELIKISAGAYLPDTQLIIMDDAGKTKAVLCDRTACLHDVTSPLELGTILNHPRKEQQ